MYRILRITDAYPPPWSGLGPGPYALSNAQAALGNEIHVIAKYTEGCEDTDRNALPRVHRIKARSYLFEALAIRKALELDLLHDFHLIHTHGSSFFLFHLLYGRKFKKPVVATIHSLRKKQFELYAKEGIKKISMNEKLSLWKEKITINNCGFFFPVSNGLKDELIEGYRIPDKNIVIPGNGAEPFFLNKPEPEEINRLKLKYALDSCQTLLFVGALNGRKDVPQIIFALKDLKQRDIQAKLVIIGSGPMKTRYEELAASSGVREETCFIHNVPQKELSVFYQLADIFAFPSFYEGLPKVVIEAMAAGLPIVCSDIPGNNQLVTHGIHGLLSAIEDREAFRNNIIQLLESPDLRARMGAAGKKKIEDEYTWRAVADRYQKAYSSLLDKNGPDR